MSWASSERLPGRWLRSGLQVAPKLSNLGSLAPVWPLLQEVLLSQEPFALRWTWRWRFKILFFFFWQGYFKIRYFSWYIALKIIKTISLAIILYLEEDIVVWWRNEERKQFKTLYVRLTSFFSQVSGPQTQKLEHFLWDSHVTIGMINSLVLTPKGIILYHMSIMNSRELL